MNAERQRLSDKTLKPIGTYAVNDMTNVRRVKEGAQASAAELREFLATMRGRSAQEMLGAVAQSSLVRCTTAATFITLAFFVVFTLGPYYLHGAPKPKEAKPAAAPAAATASTAPASTDAAGQPTADGAKPGTKDGAGKSNLEKAAEKMGLDETKASDPKKNPLDKDLDNLLDVK